MRVEQHIIQRFFISFILVMPIRAVCDNSQDSANGLLWYHRYDALGYFSPDSFSHDILGYKPAIATSTKGDIVIPELLGGYTISELLPRSFYQCASLTSVSMPNTIVSIGQSAATLRT